ncbi:DnaD domain protein [Salmonella enterica]|uniref:DnaD domain protein n=1 Tax=Salmonella enterica TaxID=28901 RepID=UPI000C224461|nr:hypothetical protein CVR98_26015 [Salmonella enterica subsp. enterica serovar Enteritidis]
MENQLNQWLTLLPKSLVVEALHRSVHANSPILYASTIIDDWKKKDVKTYKDVVKLDKNYSRDNK